MNWLKRIFHKHKWEIQPTELIYFLYFGMKRKCKICLKESSK